MTPRRELPRADDAPPDRRQRPPSNRLSAPRAARDASTFDPSAFHAALLMPDAIAAACDAEARLRFAACRAHRLIFFSFIFSLLHITRVFSFST